MQIISKSKSFRFRTNRRVFVTFFSTTRFLSPQKTYISRTFCINQNVTILWGKFRNNYIHSLYFSFPFEQSEKGFHNKLFLNTLIPFERKKERKKEMVDKITGYLSFAFWRDFEFSRFMKRDRRRSSGSVSCAASITMHFRRGRLYAWPRARETTDSWRIHVIYIYIYIRTFE